MEIVFIAVSQPGIGQCYGGVMDAVRAAEVRSGCRVWLISDYPEHMGSRPGTLHTKSYWSTVDKLLSDATVEARKGWHTAGLCRWLILRDFIKSEPRLTWPILPLDYDVMVFSDLTKAYEPLLGYDFCLPIYGIGTCAAYSVHNTASLNAAVDLMFEMTKTRPELNDMALWSAMYNSKQWNVGNLVPEINGGMFDMSIHRSEEGYMMEPSTEPMWGPETKKITWKDGFPHFTRRSDGGLVRAHWIHCWGSYKNRTKELLRTAGIET
jgi:hypothetical protein